MNLKSKSQETDISIKGVSKTFHTGFGRKKTGVVDLSLEVPRGQVIGLLGPNGSGKSTTLKMVLGFLKPSKGEIWVCGHPVPSKISRSVIGYLPENPRFPKFMSGHDLLVFYGRLLGLGGAALQKRIDYLLDLVSLKHAKAEKVQGYSKGMTQRLAIAQSLLNSPRLLIFDEPMSGLDPLGRRDIRDLIAKIHQEFPDSTIFFSSHILEDVERLCSVVALLKKGRLQKFGAMEELLSTESQKFEILVKNDPLPKILQSTEELISCLSDLKKQGKEITTLHSQRMSLETALFKDEVQP